MRINRCTLDPVILPNFQPVSQQMLKTLPHVDQQSRGAGQRILYTTFPAFKFPERFSLHIQCSLVICNTTCPRVRDSSCFP